MRRILGEEWLLPELDESNRAWFTAGALDLWECQSCGTVQHPPEEVCGHCQGVGFRLRRVRGEGRVESVAVVHRASHPALVRAVPYAVVLVSLVEEPQVHVVGNLRGLEPAEVRIGQRVRVWYEEVPDLEGATLRIPQWEPLEDPA